MTRRRAKMRGWRILTIGAASFVVVIAALAVLAILARKPDWREDKVLVSAEIKKHPDKGILYYYLGRISFKETKYNEAIKHLGDALRKKLSASEKALVYNELGDSYLRKDKTGMAEESYHKALFAVANYAPSLSALGRLYFRQRQFGKAKILFQWALEACPGSYINCNNLANACIMLDERELAVRYWRRSLELEKDQNEARELLSRYK